LSRPYIANAAAGTAVVWATQGFVPAEDAAFKKTVDDYQKLSGNKIELSSMPFMALNQKAISALTSGDVPDLIFHDAPTTILPWNAFNDKLVDVSDVVESRASHTFTEVLHSDSKIKPMADQKYETEVNGVRLRIQLLLPRNAASKIEQNVVMGPGRPGSVDKGSLEPRGERLLVRTDSEVTSTHFDWKLRF